jgi:hypothetical protein
MLVLLLFLIGLQLFANISVDAQEIGDAKPIVTVVFVLLTFWVSLIYEIRTADFSDKCGMYYIILLFISGLRTIIPSIVYYVYNVCVDRKWL